MTLRKLDRPGPIKAILFEITWAGDISKGRKGCPGCENEKSEAA